MIDENSFVIGDYDNDLQPNKKQEPMDRRYEILREVTGHNQSDLYSTILPTTVTPTQTLEAMEIYAKEYGTWIRTQGWEWSMSTSTWFNPSAGMIFGSEDGITDEKLYQLFKNDNNGE